MKHYSFPKIRQYHQVIRHLKLHHQYVGKDEDGEPIFDSNIKLPVVEFIGYEKHHGTNASIVFSHDGSFYCQSRENIVTEERDNAGFAHWVHKEGYKIFDQIKHHFDGWDGYVVLYGEFAGGSIQKGVALNQLPKMFIVFGMKKVCIIDPDNNEWVDSSYVKDHSISVYNATESPSYTIQVDLERPDKAIEQMNSWVDEIDKESPFAKNLGVSGVGEGLVFRVKNQYSFDRAFKVKGSSHSKSKIKKLPTVDVQKMDSIQQAVETHCNEDRMEQIYDKIVLSEADKVPQNIGNFIRLLIEDCWEEEGDSVRASDITRKEFSAAASKKAAKWFQEKINQF